MDSKKEIPKKFIIGALCLMVAAFLLGGYLGQDYGMKNYTEEIERNAIVNKGELEGLGEIEERIYVTGHQSPDADSVCSAIAYSQLLCKLGYDAVPVVLGDINQETQFILDDAKAEIPPLLEDASGKNMVLVDHSDYLQSSEGMDQANVLMIIDHHGDGSITTDSAILYEASPVGATATVIWKDFHDYGIEIDPQIAKLLVGAILSDTSNLTSDTTTEADLEAVKELSKLADIEDINAFYTGMYKASISYKRMSDQDIFFSDYKDYESAGTTFGIGCVEVYDEKEAQAMAERMKPIVPTALESKGIDMAFAQISIFHDDISITYLVPSDEKAAGIIETAFPDQAVFDGTSYVLNPGVSRKQVLVPAISEVLKGGQK